MRREMTGLVEKAAAEPASAHGVAELPDAASPTVTRAMEDDVVGVLGGLLGLLEVLSLDSTGPLTERQSTILSDALKFTDTLQKRVEALLILAGSATSAAAQQRAYPLRRLIDHAVRGATWSATERGVAIHIQGLSEQESAQIWVDVARIDRALRALTDGLVAALPRGAELQAILHVSSDKAVLTMHAPSHDVPATQALPELLVLAWRRLFEAHDGRLRLSASAFEVDVELPLRESR